MAFFPSFLRRLAPWLNGILLILAVFFLWRWLTGLDPNVWRSLWHVRALNILAAVGLYVVWFFARGYGWHSISRQFGSRATLREDLRLWVLSELLRYIPGNVWSFARRFQGVRAQGVTVPGAGQALIVEAMCLVASAALIAAFVAPWPWMAVIIAGVIIGVSVWPTLIGKLSQRWERLKNIPSVQGGWLWRAVVGYAGGWVLFGAASAIFFHGIPGLSWPSIVILTSISVAGWLVGYLSIVTPMGLGVREVAMAGLLSAYMPMATATVAALSSRVVLTVGELVFVLLAVAMTRRRSRT